ncbi:MAG: RIP metalloprotease RseP [Flammeovirgaceae bacterium]
MEVVIMVAQLLLGLSLLVGLHEMGHMVAAKAFGMRVEKFSIGFPPKIWGKKFGETEYSIGALPLGGFVKITGMIDESLDKESLKSEPQPWEFRSKPAWQRLIVMLGGIIVNVITGIIVFIFIMFFFGKPYIAKDDVNQHGIYVNELGEKLGLKRGDKIIAINGQDFDNFTSASDIDLLLEDNSSYTIIRNNQEQVVPIPSDFLNDLSKDEREEPFLGYLMPFKVGKVTKNSPADSAGLQKGDEILMAANNRIKYFQDFRSLLNDNKGKSIPLVVQRGSEKVNLDVNVTEKGRLGFAVESLIKSSRLEFTFVEAIGVGTVEAFSVISRQLKAFGKIFRGEVNASDSLSGPIGMAKIFGGSWQWERFWTITGMLSMVLAFMNLLPIPALDGGHVVFLTYEIVSGRAPSDKVLEKSQIVGMIILLALMAFAFGNDIYKLIF